MNFLSSKILAEFSPWANTGLGWDVFSIRSLPSRDLESVVGRIPMVASKIPAPGAHTLYNPKTCDYDTIALLWLGHIMWQSWVGKGADLGEPDWILWALEGCPPWRKAGNRRGIQCQEGFWRWRRVRRKRNGQWLLGIESDLRSTATKKTQTSVPQL